MTANSDQYKKILCELVKLYVMNPGTKHQFISCKTDLNAWSKTGRKHRVYKLWDKARKLMGAEFRSKP